MYKLILMDFSMPECDGPSSTNLIRRFLGDTQAREEQPFICFLTAYTDGEFQKIAEMAGSDYFIKKPIFKNTMH